MIINDFSIWSLDALDLEKIKKAARDLRAVQQQQQQSASIASTSVSSIFAAPTPSSQAHAPLIQVPAIFPSIAQATSHSDSLVLSNQATQNGKHRLTSQSQQHHSAKRSRA